MIDGEPQMRNTMSSHFRDDPLQVIISLSLLVDHRPINISLRAKRQLLEHHELWVSRQGISCTTSGAWFKFDLTIVPQQLGDPFLVFSPHLPLSGDVFEAVLVCPDDKMSAK